MLPLVIAQDLKQEEIEQFNQRKPDTLTLIPTYQRYYPNGGLAGHIIGYAGRTGRMPDGPIQNNEVLWPGAEGREGLEQTFDDQLAGKDGQYNITFDPSGKKVSEQVVLPPQPGYNVVTTLDLDLQKLCEETLEKGVKRGALVIIDPNNGDILAMASWADHRPELVHPEHLAPSLQSLAGRSANSAAAARLPVFVPSRLHLQKSRSASRPCKITSSTSTASLAARRRWRSGT